MADSKKMDTNKMWIIGLVALVILLGAMAFMQRNKIKKLTEEAKASSSDSGMGGSMQENVTTQVTTDAAPERTSVSTDTPV